MAITTGGRVAMKATSRAAKRRVQKMPALEKALTPAQRANKERKVAARQASKARRRTNQEAWESSDDFDIYDSIDTDAIEWFFRGAKPWSTAAKKLKNFKYKDINKVNPIQNRTEFRGLSKAFHPDDIQTISRIMEEKHPGRISSFGRLGWDGTLGEKDLYINKFNRAMSELNQAGGDEAVETFHRLLPKWEHSVEELVGLIKLGLL